MVPYQNEIPSRAGGATAFAGLNRHESIGNGEWAEMENLSVREYPAAVVRPKRRRFIFKSTSGGDTEIFPMTDGSIEDAAWTDNSFFILDESGKLRKFSSSPWQDSIDVSTSTVPKRMVTLGRDLFLNNGFFLKNPDGNTPSPSDHTRIVKTYAKLKAPCTVTPVNAEGTDITIETTKPATPANGDYYYDSETAGLYRYSEAIDEWVAMTDCYLRLEFDCSDSETPLDWEMTGDVASLFDDGQRNDCVGITLLYKFPTPANLSGMTLGEKLAAIAAYEALLLQWTTMNLVAQGFASNYIVERAYRAYDEETAEPSDKYVMILRGMFNPKIYDNELNMVITAERRMPELDYMIEHNNRIWGCRYGNNDKGEFVNEIYASAIGDPLNWFRFEGTAADSYMASVGHGTRWTGIAETDDYVYFFKEDRIFLLSGTEPSNYRLKEIPGPGVQYGSDRSVVTLGEYVYYKSLNGIMRMSPYNCPVCISNELNTDIWKKAIGGTDGRRIYMSMEPGTGVYDSIIYDGTHRIFVYDTYTGMWTVENSTGAEVILLPNNTGGTLIVGQKPHESDTPSERGVVIPNTNPVRYSRLYYDVYFYTIGVRDILGGFSTNAKPPWSGTNIVVDIAKLQSEDLISWYGITGMRGTVTTSVKGAPLADHKRVRKIQMRCKADAGTKVKVSIMYDEDGQWHEIINERQKRTGTFLLRYEPSRRCDIYRLKIEGEGPFVLYSIIDEYENAGSYGGEP